MSTQKHNFSREIDRCNHHLDCLLQERFGVSFRTYKSLMALVRLVAVLIGGGALAAGADPELVIMVVGAIVAGPDVVEAIISESADDTDR